MYAAKTAAAFGFLLLANAAEARAAGDATALVEALRQATGAGFLVTHGEIVDDPRTGEGTIHELRINRAPMILEIREVRIAGMQMADNGDIAAIGSLSLDDVDIATGADSRVTIHDLELSDLDVAALAELLENGMTHELAGRFDMGSAVGHGIALRVDDLFATMDRMTSRGIVAGRLSNLDLERMMIEDAGHGASVSLRQLVASGLSLDRLVQHGKLVEGRDEQAVFDADLYRDAVLAGLPSSIIATDLSADGPNGRLTLPGLRFESHRDGEHGVVETVSAESIEIHDFDATAAIGGAAPGMAAPNGPWRSSLSGEMRTDMRDFETEGTLALRAEGMGALDVAFSGSGLAFLDAGAAGLPPAMLSGLMIDYEDRGLVAESIDGMASAMGMDRNAFAFQIATFARMFLAGAGTSPRIGNALRAIEEFVASPERFVITLDPPEPMALDGIERRPYQLDDIAPLLDQWGVEITAGPRD